MHWDAFEARPAIRDLVGEPVTSLLWHANKIFAGHQAGGLSVYDVPTSGHAALAHYSKSFAQKTIDQLGVIKETNSLVCLSDGTITLVDLQSFAVQTTLPETKYQASLFAIDTSVQTLPSISTASRAPRGSPGVPTLCTTLVVACKRRLLIFRWRDSEWTDPHELSLPHQVRSITFSSPAAVIVGYSTSHYGSVTLALPSSKKAPTLVDLQVPTPALAAASLHPPATSTAGYSLALDKLGGLAMKTTGYMGLGGIGRVAKNDVLSVGNGETLVVRDTIGVLITHDGKLARAQASAIEFPATPEAVVFNPPYIVASFAAGTHPATTDPARRGTSSSSSQTTGPSIVIYSSSHSLGSVQTIRMPPTGDDREAHSSGEHSTEPAHTVRLLTASVSSSSAGGGRTNPLLVVTAPASDGKGTSVVWMLTMRSWDAQLADMESRGEYAEALRIINDGRANIVLSEKQARRARLQQLEAVSDLFIRKKEYDRATDVFIEHNTTPAKVVSLYPRSIAGRLYQDPSEGREAVFGGRTAQTVFEQSAARRAVSDAKGARTGGKEAATSSPSISDVPARTKALVSAVAEESDSASVHSVGTPRSSKSQTRQMSVSLESGSTAITPSAAAHSEDHRQVDFRRSVEALVRFLTDRRQQINKALSALRPSTRPSPSSPLEVLPTAAQLFELPSVPITSLTPYQLHCVAQTVDTALFKCYLATRPALLGPLCRLDNWCEIEEIEGLLLSSKRYNELLDLYRGKKNHSSAISLLHTMSQEESEAADKVGPTVAYLQKLGPKFLHLIFEASDWVFEVHRPSGLQIFVADLEEVESLPRHAVMKHLASIGADVSQTYLEHIIHVLGEEGPEFHEKLIELYLAEVPREADGQQPKGEIFDKLIGFLESSMQYRADRLLGRLPIDSMWEVRAALLGRLGQHEGALQIYVRRLEDHAMAEKYCARILETSGDGQSSIFVVLLRIYLRPKDPSFPALFEPALGLLARHGTQIDGQAVLDLLPPLITVHDVNTFLLKALRHANQLRRDSRMVREVYRAHTDWLDLEIADLEDRHVKITESRLCPHCHKRLGNSVIAVLQPAGDVVHYSCIPRD